MQMWLQEELPFGVFEKIADTSQYNGSYSSQMKCLLKSSGERTEKMR